MRDMPCSVCGHWLMPAVSILQTLVSHAFSCVTCLAEGSPCMVVISSPRHP